MSSSSLSRVPEPKRRQLAATLALFAMLFLAVAAVAETGARTGAIRAFVVIALVVAVLLALMAWGVVRSIRLDRTRGVDAELDAAIEQAVRARGDSLCSCGHEHDPTELHVTDDPCEHDGRGVECTHSCSTCVLAALRPAEPAPHRPRPAPARRPSPTRR